jgi:hypothetical protein
VTSHTRLHFSTFSSVWSQGLHAALFLCALVSNLTAKGQEKMAVANNFGQDVEFLKQHVDTIVLESETGNSQIAVVPAYQGRVMTSSAKGAAGTSFGWINYDYIKAGQVTPHINVPGGEERFWLGPEGGQFSLFFAPGAKFEFDDWQTPPAIDTEPFEIIDQNRQHATFGRAMKLRNYSGTEFNLEVERKVEVLPPAAAAESLDQELSQLNFVGYRTSNRITNTGDSAWTHDSGLLSIWLLGMYKPSPKTTVVIPFQPGPTDTLGPIVNDAYFGKVPAERLKIEDDVLFFSADGTYRSKIGLTPQRSQDICGSYDAHGKVLTIVKYNKPGPETTDYVNSMWELQDKPFSGDVVNAYNDGPPEPGAKPLGPFYELETSSPAFALKPGESGVHVQETYHFEGAEADLNRLSQALLGVSLDEITSALK